MNQYRDIQYDTIYRAIARFFFKTDPFKSILQMNQINQNRKLDNVIVNTIKHINRPINYNMQYDTSHKTNHSSLLFEK